MIKCHRFRNFYQKKKQSWNENKALKEWGEWIFFNDVWLERKNKHRCFVLKPQTHRKWRSFLVSSQCILLWYSYKCSYIITQTYSNTDFDVTRGFRISFRKCKNERERERENMEQLEHGERNRKNLFLSPCFYVELKVEKTNPRVKTKVIHHMEQWQVEHIFAII